MNRISVYINNCSNPAICCSHAKTLGQRLKGLLGSAELKQDEGMLIEPCNSVHTFGMNYSLDVVYLDKHGTVIKCISQMPPRRLSLARKARYTLELAAGAIKEYRIKKGDILSWSVS